MHGASPWLRGSAAHGVSLFAAVALGALITVFPRVVASSMQDVHHGRLMILMWGVCAGFVHGVGFVPHHRLLRWLLGPLVAWSLMGGSLIAMLLAAGES